MRHSTKNAGHRPAFFISTQRWSLSIPIMIRLERAFRLDTDLGQMLPRHLLVQRFRQHVDLQQVASAKPCVVIKCPDSKGALMIASDFRVFISAVTSEFGKVRGAVASDLRSLGMVAKVQDDFRLEADADT